MIVNLRRFFPRSGRLFVLRCGILSVTIFGPQCLTLLATTPLPPAERYTIHGTAVDSAGHGLANRTVYLVAKGTYSLDSAVSVIFFPSHNTDDQIGITTDAHGRFTVYGTVMSGMYLSRGDSIAAMIDDPRAFGKFIALRDSSSKDSTFTTLYPSGTSGGFSCLCTSSTSYTPVTWPDFVWSGYTIVGK